MSSQGFAFPPPPPPPSRLNNAQAGAPQWSSGPSRGGRGGYNRGRGASDRPMRGGFNNLRGGPTNQYNSSSNQGASRPHSGHRGGNNSFGAQAPRGQKRRHEQAFQQRSGRYEAQSSAPPPVPSFGFQLPLPPPASAAPQQNTAKPKPAAKKNVLGLTPSFDDSDSQGEVDEEAKYAASIANGVGLQFTYRGQSSSLNTAEEIQAWIAERKKKFPTKEKAAAAKEKARLDAEEKARKKAEAGEQNQHRGETGKSGRGRGNKDRGKGGRDRGSVARVQPKPAESEADRLQKELAEARKRIAELERKAAAVATAEVHNELSDDDEDMKDLLQTSSEDDSNEDTGDETTSSSGEDSEERDDEDEDEAPTEMSSRRQGPEKVPLPPRMLPRMQQVCKQFARFGHCPRGQRCKYKHEAKNGSSGKQQDARPGTVNGKSLRQVLREQQEEISDELVLQHIMFLGDRGYLAEPDTT